MEDILMDFVEDVVSRWFSALGANIIPAEEILEVLEEECIPVLKEALGRFSDEELIQFMETQTDLLPQEIDAVLSELAQ